MLVKCIRAVLLRVAGKCLLLVLHGSPACECRQAVHSILGETLSSFSFGVYNRPVAPRRCPHPNPCVHVTVRGQRDCRWGQDVETGDCLGVAGQQM